MLYIHPIIRLLSTLLLVVSIFLTKSLMGLGSVYILTILLVMSSHISLNHFRFIIYITIPLLLALLLMWGWVIDPHQVPLFHKNGINYALFLWLRVVSWGGVLQFLFVPLITQPSHLKDFLDRTGLGGTFGILIIASIVFLPEMHYRLRRIIDARRAQGSPLRGLNGIKELPTLLMPLVSSLLDSAASRAELWSHRGLLKPGRCVDLKISYSLPLSAFVFIFSLASIISVVLL